MHSRGQRLFHLEVHPPSLRICPPFIPFIQLPAAVYPGYTGSGQVICGSLPGHWIAIHSRYHHYHNHRHQVISISLEPTTVIAAQCGWMVGCKLVTLLTDYDSAGLVAAMH